MNIEFLASEKMGSSADPKKDPKEEMAKKELMEIGVEVTPENIGNVIKQIETPQLPEGFDDIYNNLQNAESLKSAMKEKGISSITHAEGKSVWDHSKLSVKLIDELEIDSEKKKLLKLIMFYHDLGKTDVWNNEQNVKKTNEKKAQGKIMQSMIGHAEAKTDKIADGLKSNGLSGKELDLALLVIKNHMQTSIPEQDPKKTFLLIESFGTNDEERKNAAELLMMLLQCDGNATQHVDLENEELRYSKNEKKLAINFNSVWSKYEEGKKIVQEEKKAQDEKQKDAEMEKLIFEGKMSDYIIKQRDIKPGPGLGEATKKIKGLIFLNKEKNPKDIRKIIDETEI